MTTTKLRLGTRGSALARWQANWVAEQLTRAGIEVELVPITTQGDASQRASIGSMGSPGVFTKELQRALLDRTIDLAVHSLKDLPTDVIDGLMLAAVPERETTSDALLSRDGSLLENLPQGAIVGTGSLRRRAQLLHLRPDLQMRDIRGNVDTRLQKLAAGAYDALVLAHAGLRRLQFEQHITQILSPPQVLPAVGQGALGIEARRDDAMTLAALAALDHPATHQSVLAERTLLALLCGGCLAPVGAWGRVTDDATLWLDAVVLSGDGRQRITAAESGPVESSAALATQVAQQLLAQGAADLIAQCRGS